MPPSAVAVDDDDFVAASRPGRDKRRERNRWPSGIRFERPLEGGAAEIVAWPRSSMETSTSARS
ncbi:hypothetical protein ACFQMM_24295 [Saliphagus sp. GCM10025308]